MSQFCRNPQCLTLELGFPINRHDKYCVYCGIKIEKEKKNQKTVFENSFRNYLGEVVLWGILGGISGAWLGALFGLQGLVIQRAETWAFGPVISGTLQGIHIGLLLGGILLSGKMGNNSPKNNIIGFFGILLASIIVNYFIQKFWINWGVIVNGLISLLLFGGCSYLLGGMYLSKQLHEKSPSSRLFYFIALLPIYGLGTCFSTLMSIKGDPQKGAIWIGFVGIFLGVLSGTANWFCHTSKRLNNGTEISENRQSIIILFLVSILVFLILLGITKINDI